MDLTALSGLFLEQKMAQPKLLNTAWGENGLRNAIAHNRTNDMAQEAATYADGFPSVTMTPISLGGKPPSGKDMNGILHEITAHIVHLNKGQRYRFDVEHCQIIGGYPKGAVLMNDNGDTEYISLVDKNTTNFNIPTVNITGKWAVLNNATQLANKADKTHQISAGAGLTGGATGHTHQLAAATPTVAGVAKLANTLDSMASDAALSAAMGKKLQDEKVAKSGDVMTGMLSINTATWGRMQFGVENGNWKLEFDPKGAANRQMNFNFSDSTGERTFIRFPTLEKGVNQMVAYQSWVNAQIDAKSTLNTINYGDNTSLGYTKTAFYRGDSKQINNIATPKLEIHITHPNAENNAYARGIGFSYGGDFSVTTTAWDSNGAYLGQRVILTELNGVMKTALSNAINSTSSSTVATSAAVKTAYDKAAAAESSLKNALPSGIIAYFAGAHQPTGWLKCNGAAVSRTTYAGVFAAIGTTYGAGDGSTTFNLPDLRGEFIRAWDDGRGVDSGRFLGSRQDDALQNFGGSLPIYTRGLYQHDITGIFTSERLMNAATRAGETDAWFSKVNIDLGASGVRTSHETRPRNIALLACIKI